MKQTAAEANFTTASFKEHSKNVDAVSKDKNCGRLCYWCIEPECLAARIRQWYLDHPKEPKLGTYKEWRSKVDRETSKNCTEYAKIDKRKKQGAVIYCLTIPKEEVESSSEDSMSSNESLKSAPKSSLHCYRSCKKYTDNCSNPTRCRQLGREEKSCPIKQLIQYHECGATGILPENKLKKLNEGRELKLERYGITDGGLKYREPRDYTPKDAIKVLYAVETLQNNADTTDESSEEEWREEDDSKYYRVEEVKEPEVEEYVMEDPYGEVKRFSDLTEDEISTVLIELRRVSPKFATMVRPEIKGGEEDRKFLKDLEKLVTSVDLIFLVMPQTEEFKRRKEAEQRGQSLHSANSSNRAFSEADEGRQIQRSEVGSEQENFKKQITRTKNIFHTSTDNSEAEDNKPEGNQKPKKQQKKQNATSDSSTEEEEVELVSSVKKRSSNKASVNQERYTEDKSADTRLLNGFFQRVSEKESMTAEIVQTEKGQIKYWMGLEIFPLIDHKEKLDKENWGPRRCQERLSWWTGITTAIWLLWVAIFTGIYPIYQSGPPGDQTTKQKKNKPQTMSQEGAEQPELQVSNQRYRRHKDILVEKQRSRNLDEDSDMQ